ncbi:MAG: hypothetical protein SFY81_07830 [Verrucomicrobiota bacterium]|nr:hypothetical protein [Verrucomicrobiota bacterium]
MQLLPVVARELLVASRHDAVWKSRLAAVSLALLVLFGVFIMTAVQLAPHTQGRLLFKILSTGAMIYCMFTGIRWTSDCLSSEKREGTLGLLFLTNLRGYDVILGKLVSSSLHAVYALFSILPVLSLALLFGGVSLLEFARVSLVLLVTLMLSLSAGMLISTFVAHERKAMLFTGVLLFLLIAGPYLLAYYFTYDSFDGSNLEFATEFLPPSILHALTLSEPKLANLNNNHAFISSLCINAFLAVAFLVIASIFLPYQSRLEGQGKIAALYQKISHWWVYGNADQKTKRRQKLLNLNPYAWLASRERTKQSYGLGVAFFFGALWILGYLQFPEVLAEWGFSLAFIHFLHLLIRLWIISEICSRMVEDRRGGALELLLATPLNEREISRGISISIRKNFGVIIGKMLLVDAALMILALNSNSQGQSDRAIIFFFFAAVTRFLVDLPALKWTSIWLSQFHLSSNRALLQVASHLFFRPFILWLLLCGLFEAYEFFTQYVFPEGFYHLCWFLISLINSAFLTLLNRKRFLNRFREQATQRFDAKPPKRKRNLKALFTPAIQTHSAVESSASARPRPLFRRYKLLGTVALVLLISITALFINRWRWDRQVQSRIAELRNNGTPTTIPELMTSLPVAPKGSNAAPLVMTAASLLHGRTLEWPGPSQLPEDWNQHLRKDPNQLKLYLEKKVRVLPLLEQAITFPVIYHPPDMDDNFVSSSHIASRDLSKFLRYSTAYNARTNRKAAVTSIVALLLLAEGKANDISTTSPTFTFVYINHAFQGMEYLFNQAPPTQTELEQLLQAFSRTRSNLKLGTTINAERCRAISFFDVSLGERISKTTPGAPLGTKIFAGLKFKADTFSGTFQKEYLKFFDDAEKYLAFSERPYTEQMELISPSLDKMDNESNWVFLLPRLDKILMQHAKSLALLDVARQAIHMEMDHLAALQPNSHLADESFQYHLQVKVPKQFIFPSTIHKKATNTVDFTVRRPR